MPKSPKKPTASRPPVDALQYEKLALSAFDVCDRQVEQLETLITLASSITRNPATTNAERRHHQTLLELLVDTAEQYHQDLEYDRELFQVIALDAKGVSHSRITASHATKLLIKASQRAKSDTTAEARKRREEKPSPDKAVAITVKVTKDAQQEPATASS